MIRKDGCRNHSVFYNHIQNAQYECCWILLVFSIRICVFHFLFTHTYCQMLHLISFTVTHLTLDSEETKVII